MKNKMSVICSLLLSVIFLISCDSKDQVLYRVQKDGLYGFINRQGEMVIEPQYKYVSHFSKDGVALVINEMNNVSVIDSNDSAFNNAVVDSCVSVNYCYINKRNKRINDNNIIKLDNNILSFWKQEGLFGISSFYNNRELLFNSRLLKQLELHDGLYVFQDEETGLLGYKDINKKVIIEPKYERCNRFNEGVAVVFAPMQQIKDEVNLEDSLAIYRLLNSHGAINTKGELVIDYDYAYIQDFIHTGTTWAYSLAPNSEGYVMEDWVLIDKNGSIIVGPKACHDAWIYNNDEYPVKKQSFGILGTYYTFVDKNGEIMSDFDGDGKISIVGDGNAELFQNVIRFSEGVAGLYANYRGTTGWYFVDSTLFPISKAYDSILPFSDNMAAAKELSDGLRASKWGFVKKHPSKNTIVQAIPFAYSKCGTFHNGLAYFCNEGNAYNVEGYIDKNGDIVWQTKRKNF